MSNSPGEKVLNFTSLELRRMPGIDPPGFSLDQLTPGINVIHGPNAAGKTSVARALNGLLWPRRNNLDRAVLRANFEVDGQDWFVKRDGSKRVFQRDGSPVNPPALPPAEQADRYNLPLHELLQNTTTNQDFAERIIRELYGGYDIPSAMNQLGFDDSPSGIGKTTRSAREAVAQVEQARQRLRELEQEARELQHLRQKREKASEASRTLDVLKQVRDWNQAREEYRQVKNQLEPFPDVMDEVTGREIETLEQRQKSISEFEQQVSHAKQQRKQYKETLNDLDYPYEQPATECVTELRDRYDRIRNDEQEIRSLKSEREAACEQRNRQAKKLQEHSTIELGESLQKLSYGDLEQFARRAEKTKTELEALERFLDLLDVEDSEHEIEIERLRRGSNVLENWLAHPPETTMKRLDRYLELSSAVLILILSGVTGIWIHPGFWAPAVLSFYFLWRAWTRRTPEAGSMHHSYQKEYEELELPVSPSRWTESEVRSVVRTLHDRMAKQQLRDVKLEEWDRESDTYEQLQQDWQEIQEKRDQLIEEIGVAPDTDERTLFILYNHLRHWQDAHNQARRYTTKIEKRQEQLTQTLEKVNEELERWGLSGAQDRSQVKARIDTIQSRVETYRETTQQLEQVERKRDRAETSLHEQRKKLKSLFHNLGIEPGDEAGLRRLCDQHEEYEAVREKVHGKRSVLENERDAMEAMEGFQPEYRDYSSAELDRKIDELRSRAQRIEEIHKEISAIETKITEAKKGYRLEEALGEQQRVFNRLEKQLDEDYRNVVGHELGKHLQQVDQQRTVPRVFEYARELLARLTAGQYELRISQGDSPGFRVIDQRTGEGKSLNHLSSATRVQVLLSVRLAFVEYGENDLRLPLYMDETLANADDERARAIIQATLELARSGRQVFYFTAQGDEVAKWKTVADRASESLNVVDLVADTDRDFEGAVRVPDTTDWNDPQPNLPEPGDRSHAEYGKILEVPPIDLRREVGSVHLWYLIEDLDTLHRLLSRRIRVWGQLETLLDLSGEDLGQDVKKEGIQRAKCRAEATRRFLQDQRRGMNRRVDRMDLQQTSAVSENFIDEVTQLAQHYDGEPRQLVDALREGEISGFRSKKMDELEEYLISEGFIDTRDPVPLDITRSRMIVALEGEDFEAPEEAVDHLVERLSEGV